MAGIPGGDIKIQFDGKTIGWCTSANWNNPRSVVSVEVLDDPYPVEMVATGYNAASVSLGFVKLYQKPLHVMGIAPKPGDAIEAITFPSGTLTLTKKSSDKVIVKLEGAQIRSESGQVSARDICMGSAELMGTKLITVN